MSRMCRAALEQDRSHADRRLDQRMSSTPSTRRSAQPGTRRNRAPRGLLDPGALVVLSAAASSPHSRRTRDREDGVGRSLGPKVENRMPRRATCRLAGRYSAGGASLASPRRALELVEQNVVRLTSWSVADEQVGASKPAPVRPYLGNRDGGLKTKIAKGLRSPREDHDGIRAAEGP